MKLKPLLLVLLSLACTATFYLTLSRIEHQKMPLKPMRSIAQTGPLKEALNSAYFAEILGLSVERLEPVNLEEAQNILDQNPLFKHSVVSTLNPEILYIDYTLRHPRFFLADCSNTVSDDEGKLFPLSPFLTPKRLPKLFLGLKTSVSWEDTIPEEKLQLALELIDYFEENAQLEWVDLSKIDAESLGEREIILIMQTNGGGKHYLRLTPKDYQAQLANYLKIMDRVAKDNFAIDLRTSKLAYLHPLTSECNF